MTRDYTPPLELGRAVTFGVTWAVLLVLASPVLAVLGLWWLARRAYRLVGLPLVVTVLGLVAIGILGRPALAAEQCGTASYYCCEHHGRLTASGEPFDQNALTAAHRSLAFGTIVRVTRTDTGASVVVRISDRGPFVAGRTIDLSLAAAEAIGMVQRGVAPVCIEVISTP